MDIIRAWKDPFYRSRLSDRDLASMPGSPAGLVELSDDELRSASGLNAGMASTTCMCCTDTNRPRRCCP
jgi:mersacidin/lichenicidin family type 2 lantibiotic